MRSYEIYKVKNEYLSFIIGRERLLYDLLREETNHQQPAQEIQYLCDHIEELTIDQAIMDHLVKNFSSVEAEEGSYRLTHPMKGSIYISVSPYSVQAYCDGSRMLDLDLFVALSGSHDRYFAVMEGVGKWGWLKPVKHANHLVSEKMISF